MIRYRKIVYRIVIGFLFLINCYNASSQTILFTDDFETDKGWAFSGEFERGTPNGSAGESPDHGYDNPVGAYGGTYAIGTDLDGAYPNSLADRAYTAVSPVLSCTGYNDVILNFQRWLNVEQPAYDHAYVEVSSDGVNWDVVWSNGATIEENAWSAQAVDISAFAGGQNNVQIRFALGSTDGGWYYSGWNIDDVEIIGVPAYYGDAPGLVFWLRGDFGVTGTSPITNWADQSGNGNDASPDPTGPDKITSASMNNQEVLSFNGTEELNIPDDSRINTGGGYDGDERSMFIAFSTGADVTTTQYLFEEGGNTNGLGVYIKNDNVYVNIYNGGASQRITVFDAISTNTDYVLSFVWDSGTLTAKLNSTSFSNQTSNGTITTLNDHGGDNSIGFTDGNTRNESGATESGPANYTGEIAEILYYDRALSTAEEATISTNLQLKYGIIESGSEDTYYSYQSGNWNDISTWTHDPGGTTHTATDIPNSGDNVIILTNRTVTLSSDVDTTNLDVTIREGGIIDQSTYQFTGGLAALRGSGTLKLASVNFPSATVNNFVNAGGGTTEYYNAADFTLTSAQSTYNNLTINAPGVIASQLSNITLNGDLHIQQGTYRINDNATSARWQIIIFGDVLVEGGALFTVGTGVTNSTTNPLNIAGGTAPFINYYDNHSHRVVIYGDFTNNGTVRFTNLAYPIFDAFPPTVVGATSGFATVYFMGATDNTLTCNNTTDFYNLVLDKGIDQTFKLTVYSSAYPYFRLFGANIAGGEGGGSNPNLKKALWIRTGSLVLDGMTIIPSLSEGTCAEGGADPNSDFYVPANGALILEGSEVVVLATADDYQEVNAAYDVSGGSGTVNGVGTGGCSSFSVLGKLQVNNGYFSTRESGGLITWDDASGQIEITGGTVDAKQFRSAGGGGGLASFDQSGGTFLLRGRFQRTPSAYASVSDLVNAPLNTVRANDVCLGAGLGTFNLNETANVFNMSGGTIRIYDACSVGGRVFDVLSSSGNISVTGGTVEFIPTAGTGGTADAAIHYIRSNAPLGNVTINRASSTTTVQLDVYPLTVLDDLTLTSGVLTANNLDVSVGGDFYIENGTTYTPGTNWTIFNGSDDQDLTVNLAATLALKKLKIDKPAGTTLTLAGSQSTISVEDSLTIISATLDDGGKTIDFTTSATSSTSYLYNSGLHTGTGRITLSDDDPQVISGDGNGIFENLELNNTDALDAPVFLGANITVNGTLTFSQDKLFDIGTYNLSMGASATISNAGTNRFIQAAGNAGDGGLTKEYSTSASSFTFPLGAPSTGHASAEYTPAILSFETAPTVYGSITVVPVGYEHPNTTTKGRSLTYFWRVKSEGFTLGSAVINHAYTYSQNDVVTGGDITENGYVAAMYDNSTYSWTKETVADVDEGNNIIGGTGTAYQILSLIDGEFTAGDDDATDPFGIPTIYYSRQSGLWSNTATWSLTDHVTDDPPAVVPGVNDIVIIGSQDSVYLDRDWTWPYNTDNVDPRSCASLKIEVGSALDIGYNTNSSFGIVLNHDNGNGNFRLTTSSNNGSTYVFPTGDFSDYNVNLGTTELYSTNPNAGTTYWLPNGVISYGNLIISPLDGSNIIFPNNDVLIYGNLITRGSTSRSWFCPTWNTNYPTAPTTRVAKTITINGNLELQDGALVWYGNQGVAQDFLIYGDLIVGENAGLQDYAQAWNQSIAIGGDLINNSLAPGANPHGYRGCDFTDIPLTFFGSGVDSITNDDPAANTYTVIESLTVNKGSSQSDSLIVNITGTFNTPNDGWLTLQNGTFKYERDANLHITQGSQFTIPSTAGLYIDAPGRTIYLADDNVNNNDVYLNGKLTLIDGNVYIGETGAPNNNNDIEYSGAGFSEIEIVNGSLTVNGQIRRNPSTTAGVLKYTQSGGAVTINGRSANTSNAKLEILNTGSEFNMSGGTITIVRGGGGGTYGDLYLRPESSSVTGGEIIFSPGSAGDQDYIFDANVPVHDLTINGNGGQDANVKLLVSPLVVNGDLTLVTATSILDANIDFDIDITINGDFDNSGVYEHRNNLTTFDGGTQSILGSSNIEFYDLDVNSVTSLTLNKDATVENDLTLTSGTLICGDYYVYAQGDVTNNATYTDNSTGLVLNGSVMQYVGGTGTWGQLELNNSAGARLENAISLQADFLLTNGIFDINMYLLTLGVNSDIVGDDYSNKKMITSDGVFSDVGVRKYYSIYSGAMQTDTIPLGTSGKYTPAFISYTENTNVGYIRVNNINDNHPGVLDPDNVLDYFWDVESNGIAGFNGSLVLNYDEGDVQVTGANTEADYIAAALLSPTTSWTKAAPGPGTDNVDETNNTITFDYSGSNSLSGEYTAGIDTALPDQVPEFTSIDDGDWSDNTNWQQTGGDPYTLTGAPNGFIVIVDSDDEVTLDINHASAYRITINGTLRVVSPTYGHNLGTVTGSGTLYLESGTFPAGRYTDFLDCSNDATLEYGGTTDYTIIADLYSSIPNLHFTGTGTRTLPSKDLTICTQLLINGPTLDNSVNNRKLTIQGTMERYGTGAFLSGSGAGATVTFAGSASQTVAGALGDFSGTNALNNLEIDNSAGLTVNSGGAIEVKRNLLLTDGVITTSATNTLTITNTAINCVTPSGGSSSSFVDGPLTKRINQGDNFSFPVGKGSIVGNKINLSATLTGTQLWTVEYFNPNGTSGSMTSPLTYVNNDEYWTVSASSGNQAIINLDWDPSSDLTPLMTENGLTDMRVARYNTGSTSWEELTSTATGDNNNGTVSTTSRVTIPAAGSSDFTTACINVVKPRAQFSPAGPVCGSDGIPVTFTYSGSIPFDYTLDYTIDGVPQAQINITSGDVPYTLPTTTSGTYQLTAFTYNSGSDVGVVDPTEVEVYDNPTTADAGLDQSLCGATSTTLDGNTPTTGTGLWTIISGTGGTVVTPTSPTSTFNGTNGTTYTLRWTITNGGCESSDDVIIDFPLLPVQPGAFTTSSSQVCQGQTGVVYTVPNDPTVTYTWNYTGTGATINGTGNSVTVDFDASATSGTLSVYATNGCGDSAPREIDITVNPVPTITLDPNIQVCQGITSADLNYTATTGSPDQYSLDFDATAEAEGFVDSVNATLTASPIIVSVPVAASVGVYDAILTVRNSTTGCESTGYAVTVTVNLPATPSLSGNDTVCVGSAGNVYTTDNGMSDYVWVVSAEGAVTSGGGSGDDSVTITWNTAGTGNVSVNYTDTNNCTSATADMDVEIMPVPATGPAYHINDSHYQ